MGWQDSLGGDMRRERGHDYYNVTLEVFIILKLSSQLIIFFLQVQHRVTFFRTRLMRSQIYV